MAENGLSKFHCARDSVRLERYTNPARPDKPLMLLFEGTRLLCEVGSRRKKNNEDVKSEQTEWAKPKSIRIVLPGKMEKDDDRSKREVDPPEGEKKEGGRENEKGATVWTRQDVHPQKKIQETEEEDNDEYYTGDTMCAWCDDGGSLVMCDGPCMRGFHMDHECNPLKVPEDLRAAVVNSKHPFECPSCWSRTHRCFQCLRDFKLDVTSDKPLLAKCDFADCGKFYCIKCQDQIVREMELNFNLSNRTKQAFICPLHFCCRCGTWEDASTDILFPCRRCPKAMHEKCMPKKIRENPTRMWRAVLERDGSLSPFSQVSENFFYCGKHQTQNMLQGPLHEVPLFTDALWKRWRTAYALKFRCLKSSADFIPERNKATDNEDLSVALAALNMASSRKSLEEDALRIAKKKRMRAYRYHDEGETINALSDVLQKDKKRIVEFRRLLRLLIEDSMKDVSIRAVEDDLTVAFPYNRRRPIKLTQDRLDAFMHSVERAKTDALLSMEHIPHKMINQMKMKYTSYGRHFTKAPVLRQIAHHAIRHVRPNDLIVDFSCGANEFIGILTDFCTAHNLQIRVKAYDLFTPFRMDSFERKNWFDVTADELDDGDNLIIGLNPPFGVNGFLANRFVQHAAGFRPRVMLLICPPETIIPDGYSLIHEDNKICKDKAFYIPGLRADQGNEVAPPFRVLQRV